MSGGIAWLEDIQQFYRERSVIEREYAQKLSGLAKKYFEKKARKTSSLSVGETPTVTPGSLERYVHHSPFWLSTLLMLSLSQRVNDHMDSTTYYLGKSGR